MTIRQTSKLITVLGALLLLGQGCVSLQLGGGTLDGGIWKSADKGENWAQKALVLSLPGVARSIANVNINAIVQDPGDPQAIYLMTNENGLIFSYDGGESWTQVAKLSVGRINSVAIDPRDKCVIFVARANQLLRSADCARTFSVVYFDTRPNVAVAIIQINSRDSGEILAGTSAGDLLRSADNGLSWTTINVFPSQPRAIVYDLFSSANIYVATANHGLWKSTDVGASWKDINSALAQFPGAMETSFLVADARQTDAYFLVSRFGILRTGDGGGSWGKINLLTPPGSTAINTFAVNWQNSREFYYGTASTFYSTADGGIRWSTRKLPTSRAATALIVDYSNPNVLYLGGTQIKK